MSNTFFGNFDLAQLSLYLFWAFFAFLIYYLQRENMREGYPLEDDDGNPSVNQGLFSPPDSKKTFNLPHARGSVTVPDDRVETRDLALEKILPAQGYPFEPTGDPMADGVGPASWAARQDHPELDGHGHPKIGPMAAVPDFVHAAGRDPRGMDVIARGGEVVGTVTDMWLDKPEFLVRYLEYELADGGGKRLVPMTLCKVSRAGVRVNSLTASYFSRVPQTKSPTEVTLLEEEKISAFYSGGAMYAK